MKTYVGIDLGSTTTKAVVLDEGMRVLGRGITNSRSNYDIACAVAKSDAMADVRFTLCSRALAETGVDDHAAFLETLTRSFRLAQHRQQLAVLATCMTEEAANVERLFPGNELAPTVAEILGRMKEESEGLFAPGDRRKSDFFRDIAASQYHRMAQASSCPEQRPFEALMAVFDKAILRAENREGEIGFEEGAGWAIDRVLAERGLAGTPAGNEVRAALSRAFSVQVEAAEVVGTGYGRARLPFEKRQIRSEILCHGLGAHQMFPDTRTVLDIGGQDTKAIQVDGDGIVTSFQMNDRCAAGCGRYLGYIADEMNLGLHELGPLASKSTKPVKINSTCTVFAGAEIRDRLTLGQQREDILAGLHRAVMLRAMSLLARSGGIEDQFTFTGGVAKNVTAVKVLRQLVEANYGARTLNISEDSIYTGALGAALFAWRAGRGLDGAADSPKEVTA